MGGSSVEIPCSEVIKAIARPQPKAAIVVSAECPATQMAPAPVWLLDCAKLDALTGDDHGRAGAFELRQFARRCHADVQASFVAAYHRAVGVGLVESVEQLPATRAASRTSCDERAAAARHRYRARGN